MSTMTSGRATLAIGHPGRARAIGVAAATVAALAVWAVAVPGIGVDLLVRFGTGAAQTVQPWFVLGAALAASLCGWGLLAMLERRTERARAIWTTVAVIVLLASLSLPAMAGVTVAASLTLASMHVAVAAVLIPVLRHYARASAVQAR